MDNKNKLIILDIDETLIHSTETSLSSNPDFIIAPYYIYKRPYVDEFLLYCRKEFEVAIWTSGTADYALAIINALFPKDYPLAFSFFRDRCTSRYNYSTGSFDQIKDLKKVKRKGYALHNVLMIEDSPENLARQYSNVIPIESFTGDSSDNELQHLIVFLDLLKTVEDVRKIEKRDWKNRLKTRNAH